MTGMKWTHGQSLRQQVQPQVPSSLASKYDFEFGVSRIDTVRAQALASDSTSKVELLDQMTKEANLKRADIEAAAVAAMSAKESARKALLEAK